MHSSRRVFLQSTLAALPTMHGLSSFAAPPSRPKLPVAGIVTSMGNATSIRFTITSLSDQVSVCRERPAARWLNLGEN